jgi:hypothetical protein
MRPEGVLSPRRHIKSVTIKVTRKTPKNNSYSIAEIEHRDGTVGIGIRWNGNPNDPKDKGYPTSRGHPVWFELPREMGLDLLDSLTAKA